MEPSRVDAGGLFLFSPLRGSFFSPLRGRSSHIVISVVSCVPTPHGVNEISAVVLPNTMPDDPSEMGFPANLPLEIAMGDAPVKEICQSYGIARSDWQRLRQDPHFIQALEEAHTLLSQEGAMFRAKIKAQAEGVLARNWQLIHSSTELVPATVQAEQIRFTIRAAGLDASVEQKARAAGNAQQTNALQINLILGDN